ncbi:MAG: FAD:protein FMN transferase [Verrucomicrobiota bacterium]|nr:FAD:protein FMN transferase [Verrucomicrobiota bacterium]
MKTVSLARDAMATRFEMVLHGEDEPGLRAAGEEALDEITALAAQLNFHCAESEVSRINAGAALGAVQVEPGLFRLLRTAKRIHEQSGGAFDVTVAPLMRCWGFWGGARRVPSPEELARVRASVGMDLVHLDEENFTVFFECPGVQIDLGAIGKGFALDAAAGLLREAGVTSALIHGGTSSVCTIGSPPDKPCWKTAIEWPSLDKLEHTGRQQLVSVARLSDESLGVSSSSGRAFKENGVSYGHVLDPRRGEPTHNALLAAVALPSGTAADAWSTALLVSAEDGAAALGQAAKSARSLLLLPDDESGCRLTCSGFEPLES